ncbi:hypothetical protein FRACA_3230002 [Frankia canadensis]|uniref:Uncharacterized protein n=1 Tax=Frankia canadensis TaxID=1836972 RepID=A0A2I2KUN7_9ACTN|nr:hypothetical protein FRACA_3230002 [Frankia canadensis]SOU56662.1 hypothetical protein FRACA_3230002 [Frankia canadensis]
MTMTWADAAEPPPVRQLPELSDAGSTVCVPTGVAGEVKRVNPQTGVVGAAAWAPPEPAEPGDADAATGAPDAAPAAVVGFAAPPSSLPPEQAASPSSAAAQLSAPAIRAIRVNVLTMRDSPSATATISVPPTMAHGSANGAGRTLRIDVIPLTTTPCPQSLPRQSCSGRHSPKIFPTDPPTGGADHHGRSRVGA